MRRLSDKEFQEKHSKDLNFRCDEKCNFGHKYSIRKFSVMLSNEEKDEVWSLSKEAQDCLLNFIGMSLQNSWDFSQKSRRSSLV